MSEWIPVTKELPPPFQEVEIFFPEREHVRIAERRSTEGWFNPQDGDRYRGAITHWRKIDLPPMPDLLVFAYYDTRISDRVHLDVDGEPACGQSYGEEGEFLRSKLEYDASLFRALHINLYLVTCKKCLKILQRAKGGQSFVARRKKGD